MHATVWKSDLNDLICILICLVLFRCTVEAALTLSVISPHGITPSVRDISSNYRVFAMLRFSFWSCIRFGTWLIFTNFQQQCHEGARCAHHVCDTTYLDVCTLLYSLVNSVYEFESHLIHLYYYSFWISLSLSAWFFFCQPKEFPILSYYW